VLTVLLIGIAGLAQFVLAPSTGRVAVQLLITIGLVVGIQVFVGNSGILSFGHVSFFAVGAYVAGVAAMKPSLRDFQVTAVPSWLADRSLGFWPALLLAVAVGVTWAALTGFFVARMKTTVIAMATLALLVVTFNVVNSWESATNGNQGLAGVPQLTSTSVALGVTIVITGAAYLFAASPTGLRLQATREDEVAARALGVSVCRARFWGWLLSGVLVSLAGAVWALNARAFAPSQFSFEEMFALLAMLVVGGLGSVSGAVTGAVALTVLTELIRTGQEALAESGAATLPGLIQLSTAAIIIVVLVVRPLGLTNGREPRLSLPRRKAST